MDSYNFVTLLSLGLTPLTIIGCCAVVYIWRKAAIKALKTREKTEVSWIILGVVVGFAGSFIDNLYWGLAWASDYAHLTPRDWLFKNGVYSNTPFRQVATIIAAVCHIRAGMLSTETILRWVLYIGAFTGILFTVTLFFIKMTVQ